MRWPHWVVVTTPDEPDAGAGGDTGGGFGEPVVGDPAPPLTLLDCAADCQDVGQVVPRMATGLPGARADATVFVQDESRVFDVHPGATATVTLNPHRAAGVDALVLQGPVTYARTHDGALICRFLDPG